MKTALLTLLIGLVAQDKKTVDPKKVDAAINKGVEWLSKQPFGETIEGKFSYHEIVLFTFLHAGVSREHPIFQKLLDNVLKGELKSTYTVSLQAMALSELDPTKHQQRIAQCGQFLVDNQCQNGQWEYGAPVAIPKDFPTTAAKKDVETPGGSKPPKGKSAPPARPKTQILLKKQKGGPDKGDDSNSQYAALGLRACMEANVFPPRETLESALQSWERGQSQDGGWGYFLPGPSYGSMTAGAVGSVIIYREYLKLPWRTDPAVVKGIEWIKTNFTVTANPKFSELPDDRYVYYYLYAVERAGVFSQQTLFGDHDWYREGATEILKLQTAEGSWSDRKRPISDTCFAILFLRRATRPLVDVASVDRVVKPKEK
jgi:hypothetical protein